MRKPPEGLRGRAEPRIWTRPLRELTPDTSFGFEAIEFITDVLGETLLPWQEWFLIHSLEVHPDFFTWSEYPLLRFDTVLLLVARQQGKSTVMSRRGLWRMECWEGPEVDPVLVLGTAHKLTAAGEVMSLAMNAVKRSGEIGIAKHSRTNGDIHFELDSGARYKIEAANDDGGRSMSATDVLFDELRQQRDFSSWAAFESTTTAKRGSQIVAVSNAGEAKSEVLKSVRANAIAQKDTPTTQIFIAEYSGVEGCDIDDWDQIAQANPALGWPINDGLPLVTAEKIAAKISKVGKPGEGMPEGKYRAETLCQFDVLAVDGPFVEGAWAACEDSSDPEAEYAGSQIDSESLVGVGFDVSHDRSMTYIAVAGYRSDCGPNDEPLVHVEVVAKRAGMLWVPDYVRTMHESGRPIADRIVGVAFQAKGCPASDLADEWDADADVTTIPIQGPALGASFGGLHDAIRDELLRHRGQEVLTLAADAGKTKKLGDVVVLDRAGSPVDVAPMAAVQAALWALKRNDKAAPKKRSAYEDSDLVVI